MAEPAKASQRSAKRICAVYTRKSSEEGLDQAFNSLDAQRDACAAFILSQKAGRPRRRSMTMAAIPAARWSARCPSVIARGRRIAYDLGTLAPEKVKAMLMALCCRTEIGSDRIDIALSRSRVAKLIRSSIDFDGVESQREQHDQAIASNDLLTLTAPASLMRVGRGMRMLLETVDSPAAADSSLLRILSRAYDTQARLIQDPSLAVHDVAADNKLSAAHLYTILRLAWLAPDSPRLSSMAENRRSSPPRP